MNDQFEWWKAALAGNRGDITAEEPQAGYYRNRRKGQQAVPVVYWRDSHDGALRCQIDGADVDERRAIETWPFASKEPVTHEAYKARMATGKWPDMDQSVADDLGTTRAGHNKPPTDEAELLKGQIDAASEAVKDYAKIEDDVTLAKAQSLRSRLLELSGTADKTRVALKEPHKIAGEAVDSLWMPLVKTAKAAADQIRSAMSAWETRKEAIAREAHRKAEEARRKAEDEAKAAEASGKPLPPPPPPPQAPPPPPEAIRGAYGRAATVKQIKVAVIVDQAKVYETFKDRAEVIELLRKLAQRAVDDGYDVPGTTIEQQRRVS